MYLAKLVNKKRLFQPAYEINHNMIFITNTSRAKKRFIKDNIKNVYFGCEFEHDSILGEKLVPAMEYDYTFLQAFLPQMIEYVAHFFKIKLPCEDIAVFSSDEKTIASCISYAKMVTVINKDGKSELRQGVTVRYLKKIKTPPDIIVTDGAEDLSPVFKVPRINLGKNTEKSPRTLTSETLSFENSVFPFEINLGTLLHLIKTGTPVTYKLTSFRKRCPPLFTFS